MCDDITEIENGHWLLGRKLGRREFAAMGAGAAAFAMLPGCVTAQDGVGGPVETASRTVDVATPDGTMDGFFVTPVRGKHPAVILWPDIAGLRDAYKMMATRLAASGYAVLVVNQYYRSARAPVLASFAEWRTDAGRARLQPMIAALSPAGTTRDAAAFITWLDAQREVDTAKTIGSSGLCMGGPFAFRTAAANPARVGAIASFHGGGLVTDTTDSPHLLIDDIRAAMQLHAGVFRTQASMDEGVGKIGALAERVKGIHLADKSKVFNTARVEALEVENLIEAARATMVSAAARHESRGAHTVNDYADTPEHPNGRNDEVWMKHTLWYSADNRLDYKPVNLKPLTAESIPPKVRTF